LLELNDAVSLRPEPERDVVATVAETITTAAWLTRLETSPLDEPTWLTEGFRPRPMRSMSPE